MRANINFNKLTKPFGLASALVLAGAAILPALMPAQASAYGLLGSRKVTVSSSASGATTAGQDVVYEISFNVADDTQNVAGVVVDFCGDSPIIGDTCTPPFNFNLDPANLALTLNSGLTGFTVDTGNSTASKLVLTGAAYNTTPAQNLRFTLGSGGNLGDAGNGVHNPETSNTVFYARILTFTTSGGATGYTSTSPGAEPPLIDAGGVALSTANQITITSKVQERLTFCVFVGNADGSTNDSNDCAAKTGNAISLGNDNGVLDTTDAYINKQAQFAITTNAQNNAVVRIKGGTLTSGSNNITALTTPATSLPGSEQFGVCAYQSQVAGTGADLTFAADYDGGAGAQCAGTADNAGTTGASTPNGAEFGFNTVNTTSTYGDTLATKPAGDFSTARLAFIGNISNITEAGIYTSTLTFIATGSY